MLDKLRWETVNAPLKNLLLQLMETPLFDPFRLVGGTSLSLQIGHRTSIDIDLFCDAPYGSLDFEAMDKFLRQQYRYVSRPTGPVAMGRSYFIGDSAYEAVKLDLYYTDNFIEPAQQCESVRLATQREILAMKMDVVQRGGRKKDFWDLHYYLPKVALTELLDLHEQRYPYTHSRDFLQAQLTAFGLADKDLEPNCLLGKVWDTIKLDFLEYMDQY